MFKCGAGKYPAMTNVLNSLQSDKVKLFSLEDCYFVAKCVEVYDGDTITVIICMDFGDEANSRFFKFKVRLYGINTPEIRTKDKKEKQLGYEARDYLRSLVLGELIYLKCGKFDKYGRLLGVVFTLESHENINEKMLEKGYAIPYLV